MSTSESPFCLAYSPIIERISETFIPSLRSSLKEVAVFPDALEAFSKFSLAVVPLFPSSERIVERAVVAISVLVPCLVIRAIADATCSKDTPKADAVGVTLESALPSCPTVVTPLFCVCNKIPCILSRSFMSILYAFKTDRVALIAVSVSVNPPDASFALFSTADKTSDISSVGAIPALIA